MNESERQGPGERLWTADDVAEFLGVSVSWVYQAARNAAIPCLKIGNSLRFVPQRVHAWTLGQTSGERVQLPTCEGRNPARH
jgi:excisionase family DNA binding protein